MGCSLYCTHFQNESNSTVHFLLFSKLMILSLCKACDKNVGIPDIPDISDIQNILNIPKIPKISNIHTYLTYQTYQTLLSNK